MRARVAPMLCIDAVNETLSTKCETAGEQHSLHRLPVDGLQAGGSGDPFSGGAHPYPQGLSDTGNLTFIHNLMASLVGVLAISITLQHLLKYR